MASFRNFIVKSVHRRHNWILGIGFLFFAATIFFALRYFFFTDEGRTNVDDSGNLQLVSPAFRDGTAIPAPYSCEGQNVSPPLNILGAPKQAKSFALIMHDPDAAGNDFVHWTVWDMPSSTESIAANSVPVGAVQGANGTGASQYMGPCPPPGSGVHNYKFELYALDKALSLPSGSTREQLQKAIEGHIVANSTLSGTYAAK